MLQVVKQVRSYLAFAGMSSAEFTVQRSSLLDAGSGSTVTPPTPFYLVYPQYLLLKNVVAAKLSSFTNTWSFPWGSASLFHNITKRVVCGSSNFALCFISIDCLFLRLLCDWLELRSLWCDADVCHQAMLLIDISMYQLYSPALTHKDTVTHTHTHTDMVKHRHTHIKGGWNYSFVGTQFICSVALPVKCIK